MMQPTRMTDDDSRTVLRSARYSLGAQALFTVVTAVAIALPTGSDEASLRPITILETVAQVIEFAYYALAVYYAPQHQTRYLDVPQHARDAAVDDELPPLPATPTTGCTPSQQTPFHTITVLGFNLLMLVFGLRGAAPHAVPGDLPDPRRAL